jgi:phosphopantetheinyl transferase
MIGNDVVDLADAETRESAIHARFDARVFAPAELRGLARAGDRTRLRWSLWAAKEAAYKAAKRIDPALGFSPVSFVVELGEDGRGIVVSAAGRFAVDVAADEACLHAVATTGPAALRAAFRTNASGDASLAARRFALADAARELGVDPARTTIETSGRLPWLRVGERRLPLSLSHHGSWIGYATLSRETV